MSEKENTCEEDEELSNLLDCALKDFDEPIQLKPKTEDSQKIEENQVNIESTTEEAGEASVDPLTWDYSKLEEAMCSLLSEDKQLKDNLNNLAAATQGVSATSDEEFAASLANTLKGLADNAENIFDPSNEDFTQLLSNLAKNNEPGNDEAIPDILPFMQDIMQKLLSKELLYPALKDMVEMYPKWLEERQGKLEQKQYDSYCQQYELMKKVCEEFEKGEDNNAEIEKERFEKILQLMQKMQDCGHPPKELVGVMAPEIEFDEQGNPKIPGLQGDQCCIM